MSVKVTSGYNASARGGSSQTGTHLCAHSATLHLHQRGFPEPNPAAGQDGLNRFRHFQIRRDKGRSHLKTVYSPERLAW